MTYFEFLARFVVPPIVILMLVSVWDERRGKALPGFNKARFVWIALTHVALALVYTTPWDNYLVASQVWSYNPELVTGIVIGWVPLEEYVFFVLETILSALWWLFLARRLAPAGEFRPDSNIRRVSAVTLILVWLVFCGLLLSGWRPMTYLSITLAWALPAILPQFLFGADILWHYRRLVFWSIFVPGLYLSLTDIVALKAGTWAISPEQTSGVLFFGVLPLEEVVFFFITNVLIGFGMTLMLSNLSQLRLEAWRAGGYKGWL